MIYILKSIGILSKSNILYLMYNIFVLIPFFKLGNIKSAVEIVELIILFYLSAYIMSQMYLQYYTKKIRKGLMISLIFSILYIMYLIFNLTYTEHSIWDAINEIRKIMVPFLFYYSIILTPEYPKEWLIPKVALYLGYILVIIQLIKPELIKEYYLTYNDGSIIKTNFIAGSSYNRVLGIFDDANVFGYFMVSILAIKLSILGNSISVKKGIGVFFDILIILLTQSRGAMGCMAIILIAYICISSIKTKVKVFVLCILGVLGITFIYPQLYEILILRFNKNVGSSGFSDPRFVKWATNAQEIVQSIQYFLGGKGLGATGIEQGKIIMENGYLDIWYKTGIAGIVLYFINILNVIFRNIKKRIEFLPLLSLMIASIIADLYRIPSIVIVIFIYYGYLHNRIHEIN